jgi:CheY-like chemotaxis protein
MRMLASITSESLAPMTATLPRLLLVEDDPISRQFLVEALRPMPATVDAAASVAEACAIAMNSRHALWLIDAHLPDGDGIECLRRLRELSPTTTAVSITAETDRGLLDRLIAAGFIEVLAKPISLQALQGNVRRLAGLANQATYARDTTATATCGKLPCWDETAALAALNGDRASLEALRGLFLAELPDTCRQLEAAAADADGERVRAILHRLKASCAFVGAARLADAVRALSEMPLDVRRLQLLGFAAADLAAMPDQS